MVRFDGVDGFTVDDTSMLVGSVDLLRGDNKGGVDSILEVFLGGGAGLFDVVVTETSESSLLAPIGSPREMGSVCRLMEPAVKSLDHRALLLPFPFRGEPDREFVLGGLSFGGPLVCIGSPS